MRGIGNLSNSTPIRLLDTSGHSTNLLKPDEPSVPKGTGVVDEIPIRLVSDGLGLGCSARQSHSIRTGLSPGARSRSRGG
jgi:hypothetical protein